MVLGEWCSLRSREIMVINGSTRSIFLLENVHGTEEEDDGWNSGPVGVLCAVPSQELPYGINLGELIVPLRQRSRVWNTIKLRLELVIHIIKQGRHGSVQSRVEVGVEVKGGGNGSYGDYPIVLQVLYQTSHAIDKVSGWGIDCLVLHVDAVHLEVHLLDEAREWVGGVDNPCFSVGGFEGVTVAAVADGDEHFHLHVHASGLLLELLDGFWCYLRKVPDGAEDAVGGLVEFVVIGGEGECDLILLQDRVREVHLLERIIEGVLTENGQHCVKEGKSLRLQLLVFWCGRLHTQDTPYILVQCRVSFFIFIMLFIFHVSFIFQILKL